MAIPTIENDIASGYRIRYTTRVNAGYAYSEKHPQDQQQEPPPLPPSVKPLVTLAGSHFECVVDLVLVFQARPRLESEIFELPPRRQGRAVLPLAFMQLLGWG